MKITVQFEVANAQHSNIADIIERLRGPLETGRFAMNQQLEAEGLSIRLRKAETISQDARRDAKEEDE